MQEQGPLPTLVLVDDDEETRTLVRYAVEGRYRIVGEAVEGERALQLVRSLRPDLVLMDMDLPSLNGSEITRVLTEQFPEVAVVVISAQQDFDRIRTAMTAGAREFVAKPFSREELLEVIDRTGQRHEVRKKSLNRAHELPSQGIWCFLRGTGGVGQSTLMLSLASELAELKRSVVVLDLEALFGNAAFYLGVTVVPPHLGDAIEGLDTLTAGNLDQYLRTHPSGVQLLAPPTKSLAAHEINMAGANQLFPVLREVFDYVLVDLPVGLPETFLPALDEARYLFLCSDSTYGSVKNLGVMLGLMEVLEYPEEKIRSLILRSSETEQRRKEIDAMVEAAGSRISARFPNDVYAASRAVRKADTIPRVAPRSQYTLAVQEYLADLLDLPRKERPNGLWAKVMEQLERFTP